MRLPAADEQEGRTDFLVRPQQAASCALLAQSAHTPGAFIYVRTALPKALDCCDHVRSDGSTLCG